MSTKPGIGTVCFDLIASVLATAVTFAPVATLAQDSHLKSAYVIINRSEPAFTTFFGVPTTLPKEKLDEIRAKVARQSGATLVTWGEFKASVNGIAKTTVLKYEYLNYPVVDGIACLVGRVPGGEWGLTWNGGIALTFRDYQHVRRTYQIFKEHPETYQPIRDPSADPVNPGGFLPLEGCINPNAAPVGADQASWAPLTAWDTTAGHQGKLYIDRDLIKRDGTKRRVWELVDQEKPEPFETGSATSYVSWIASDEYDCNNANTVWLVEVMYFSGHMGTAALVHRYVAPPDQMPTRPITPDSRFALIKDAVCK